MQGATDKNTVHVDCVSSRAARTSHVEEPELELELEQRDSSIAQDSTHRKGATDVGQGLPRELIASGAERRAAYSMC